MRHVGSALSACAFLALFSFGFAPSAQASAGWNVEILDAGNSQGMYTSTMVWENQHHVFNQGTETAESVLRHGWYEPRVGQWQFETLDKGNSSGVLSSTFAWYQQQHVFNVGVEGGTHTLRHGWYEPSFGQWQFETLDRGFGDGGFSAATTYAGQQHVFGHGVDNGQDVVRHGWYDAAVGVWRFETLDPGGSAGLGLSTMTWGQQLHIFGVGQPLLHMNHTWQHGPLRHGWYEPLIGRWQFETLDPDPWGLDVLAVHFPMLGGRRTISAFVGGDGRQNVAYLRAEEGVYDTESTLRLGWYDGAAWQFVDTKDLMIDPSHPINGLGFGGYALETVGTRYGSHTELFTHDSWNLHHGWWDGASWHPETLGKPYQGGQMSAVVYGPTPQLHVFNRGFDSGPPASPYGLRHMWYDPIG